MTAAMIDGAPQQQMGVVRPLRSAERAVARVRELDTKELLAEAAAGRQDAWSEVYRRYSNLVFWVARRAGLDEADAADVCQTSFLRLLDHVDRIADPERVGAWLATTARRESVRVQQRHRRQHGADLGPEEMDVRSEPPDARLLADERADAVHRAVDRLPGRSRQLVGLLLDDREPTYVEIAERLSMPVGSIGPTRLRMLRSMRHMPEVAALA
ncbi:MAG: sigma-70 family RNA polymerase sigma factor [Actinomycetota bacterium]|nr:sigma-70 family RNA polymerase sigma factor [Actinomycetota bacterium]